MFSDSVYKDGLGADEVYEEVPEKQASAQLKLDLWETAIGLQQIDGVLPSEYLVELANQNINGEIKYETVEEKLEEYYETDEADQSKKEADITSARIVSFLATHDFSYHPAYLISIHKYLFDGLDLGKAPVGSFRDYNINKKQVVLNGATVVYSPYGLITDTLIWDFNQEKNFDSKGFSKTELAHHAMKFISGIWQIHPFGEGNTRTTSTLAIQYLEKLGFELDHEPFKLHASYYRNALVFDNTDLPCKTDKFLKKFTENLLLDGKNKLDEADMIVWRDETIGTEPRSLEGDVL
jgi:fido (protein-threonine AMPylation protein)